MTRCFMSLDSDFQTNSCQVAKSNNLSLLQLYIPPAELDFTGKKIPPQTHEGAIDVANTTDYDTEERIKWSNALNAALAPSPVAMMICL